MSSPLVIGSRGSALALWQARWVAGRLGGEAAGVRIEVVKTTGDVVLHRNLAESPDKGLFTRELEAALLEGRVDLAVHSLKDLPTLQPPGLTLSAVPERASVGDVILVRPDALDPDRPLGLRRAARVGTGSPRRLALLRHVRPDAVAPDVFRGNVPTRVRKCVDGEVDALVLARAGLVRLGLDPAPLVPFDLDPARWLPAPGQGALGLQSRAEDERVAGRLAALHDADAWAAVGAERELLARMEAGCHAALGAWARATPAGLRLDAGALTEAGTWRAVSVTGPSDGLAARAHEALDAAEDRSAEGSWHAPAAPWAASSPEPT